MDLSARTGTPFLYRTGVAVFVWVENSFADSVCGHVLHPCNPDGYRKGSPIHYAEGLKGNLLLIHGTGDDNVHYQSCEMMVNELVRLGKVFYQISYPMRSHSINERQGTTLHLRRTMADFWFRNLPSGGR